MEVKKNIAVLGGGAAGFFAAISAKTHHPEAEVILFEKTSNVLAKVKVSGGGRCNVTNGNTDINSLCLSYPRGGKKLKKILHQFSTQDTKNWFEKRGVPLNTEADQRIFPVSNQSQSIIDCLMEAIEKLGVNIKRSSHIKSLKRKEEKWILQFNDNGKSKSFDSVIVATGGSPKLKSFDWLKNLGHKIIPPVPSLFTFNMPKEPITALMGIAVEEAQVRISGTKILTQGPLLITHWGMSGPAILKASSFGARALSDKEYQFEVQVNWLNESNTELLFEKLQAFIEINPQKKVINHKAFPLPQRLWKHLVVTCGIPVSRSWKELGKKKSRQLITLLSQHKFKVAGKTTFKEEFVTCGGVSLDDVDLNTLKSKIVPNLYFAGEVIDVDAITGGYNFQAAWSTGFIAGKLA
jgi:predicted Rossmann fold flavoprotein